MADIYFLAIERSGLSIPVTMKYDICRMRVHSMGFREDSQMSFFGTMLNGRNKCVRASMLNLEIDLSVHVDVMLGGGDNYDKRQWPTVVY